MSASLNPGTGQLTATFQDAGNGVNPLAPGYDLNYTPASVSDAAPSPCR